MDPADALAQKLDAHRRHVLDAAAGKEADSFGATAATYGVTASSPTPEALTAIGEAIVAHCSEALTQVQGQADPRRVTFLRGRLERYASELAQALDTIPYEVLCSVSPRVPRSYEGGS